MTVRRDAMRLSEPFRISGYLFEAMPAIVVTLSDGQSSGRGEAAGVYYLGDDPAHMEGEIERCRATIEAGVDREALRALLPAGGARNAVDCALWELESQRAGVPVWALAGSSRPKPLITTFTLPADDPAEIARRLVPLADARAIKLKLTGEFDADAERVRTVRRLRPSVWLGVDANQGYGPVTLEALIGVLVDENVSLLEQPIRRGEEAELEGLKSPIPIAADESILDLAELRARHASFDVINIKLDKCGGLTEALEMAQEARQLGKKVMVGNMAGSVLATAPSFVLGQFCDVVDLDGPYFLAEDPWAAKIYADGRITIPDDFWGAAEAPVSAGA
jgi:L-alanine-DL-glutamate epimerase-like enolase superfamily enzyme